MSILFKLLGVREEPPKNARCVFQLSPGDWDDYSFKTSFHATLYDTQGKPISLGVVKIGYVGQTRGWTRERLPETFSHLPDGWFSLGQDVEYYKKISNLLSKEDCAAILLDLKDIVADEAVLAAACKENVFKYSLIRGISMSVINGQFKRVLNGEVELTDYHFAFKQEGSNQRAAANLNFRIEASSKPSTNIHVLIGRNGVGKTTLLNNMVEALLDLPNQRQSDHRFYEHTVFESVQPLPKDYFSSVVSVSFSAFDPFLPPKDKTNRINGPAYFYIGMKNARAGHTADKKPPPKTDADLVNDFVASFRSCLSQPEKRDRWHSAINRLESDPNFKEMDLGRLLELDDRDAIKAAGSVAGRMSSGHSIVLLTVTKLVDTVEEKTLVLLDEPESHLHPPLLSAFTRALSELLYSRNGVAIIATHSPVVLQEVPRSCVWKLTRFRTEGRSDRPERETFGENVGILTREIFGLEVSKSGFHEMMQHAVDLGGTFESIVEDYGGQLGAEAKAILLSLIAARGSVEGKGL